MALQRPLAYDHRVAGAVNVRSRTCGVPALVARRTGTANTVHLRKGSHSSPAGYVVQGGQRRQLILPTAAVDAAAAAAAALIAEPLGADCLHHPGTAAAAAEGACHSHTDAENGSDAVSSSSSSSSSDGATAERWLSHSQASTSGRSCEGDSMGGVASPVQLHLAAAHLPTTMYMTPSSNGNGRGHQPQHHLRRQQQQHWRWWQHQQQQQQQQQQQHHHHHHYQQQQQQEEHSADDGDQPHLQEGDHNHRPTSSGRQQRSDSSTAAGPGRPSQPAPTAGAAAAVAEAGVFAVAGGRAGTSSRGPHAGAPAPAAVAAAAGHSAGAPWSARLLRPAPAPLRPGCACSPSHVAALAAALQVSPRAVEPLLRLRPELSAHDPSSISSRVEELSAALGCSQRQAAAMVSSHPTFYLQQPLEELEGRAQQLAATLGLSQQQVVAWAAATPSVLKRAPGVVATRVQRLCSWLDAPAAAVVAAIQAAPELLTVRLAAAQRRTGFLQRLLFFKQEVQVRRLVLLAPQVLFVSPRIVLSKVRVLMGIFEKDRRAVGRLVYTTPQLLACNLNHLRTTYQQLQLRLQRSAGYVFAMCCHSAQLLLLPGPRLAARVAVVCQAAALVPTWGTEWGHLKPPQMHACLAAGRGRYGRLHYLLLTQQAQLVGLQQALLMPATQWQQQFPGYAAWVQAATQQQQQQQQQQWRHVEHRNTQGSAQVSSSSSPMPLPATSPLVGSRAQQHQVSPPAAAKLVSYQQLQQQWVQGWQTGVSRHQSWSQQLSTWDRLQRAKQQQLRRHQQQAAWMASTEQQQQQPARGLGNKHKRRRGQQRQQEEEEEEAQQSQQGRTADAGSVACSSSSSAQSPTAAAVGMSHSTSGGSGSSSGGKTGHVADPGATGVAVAGDSPGGAARQHAAAVVEGPLQLCVSANVPSSSSSSSSCGNGSRSLAEGATDTLPGVVGSCGAVEAPTTAGRTGEGSGVAGSSCEGSVFGSSREGSELAIGEGAAAVQVLDGPGSSQEAVAAAEDVVKPNTPKLAGAGGLRQHQPSSQGGSSMGQYRAAPGRRLQGASQQRRQYGQQQQQQQQQLSVVHASHSFGLSVE